MGKTNNMEKEIVVALGGGGSRGNAHIGVLKMLEENGFIVRALAGTSFGGLIACLYGFGYRPQEIEDYFEKIDQSDLYGRIHGEGPSILGLSGVRKILDDLFGENHFKSLKIPCALTALDLNTGEEITLENGLIKTAILATIAIPGIFPPQKIGDRILIDGGVVNPVPVSVARKLQPGLPVIAVTLSGTGTTSFTNPISKYFVPNSLYIPLIKFRVPHAFNIFLQSIYYGNRKISELRLAIDQPDIIIFPDVTHIGLLDKVDIPAIVKLGEKAVQRVLPELNQLFGFRKRLSRKIKFSMK